VDAVPSRVFRFVLIAFLLLLHAAPARAEATLMGVILNLYVA
jgi:hypothetical protein